jgi:hypothetical protein
VILGRLREGNWRGRLMDLVYEAGQPRPRPYFEEELAFIA